MTFPEVRIFDSPEEASKSAADSFAGAIADSPEITLGLATGGTPKDFYRFLVDARPDFSKVRTFNLDEYVGIAPDHPQGYRQFMHRHLFDAVEIPIDQTHFPNAAASDPFQAAAEYETQIRDAGGIDLQLLGIGHNGHIAFNEPGSVKESRTRVVELSESTIQANARFFDRPEDVPRLAISMGIATILEAKRIAVLAFGEAKADAVAKALQDPIHPNCPASFLRQHPNVIWYLDRHAAHLLENQTTDA